VGSFSYDQCRRTLLTVREPVCQLKTHISIRRRWTC